MDAEDTGQTNPIVDIRREAAAHGQEAVLKLLELLRGENPSLAKAAADALLDRGFGKPSQEVDLVADVTAVVSVVERRLVRSS